MCIYYISHMIGYSFHHVISIGSCKFQTTSRGSVPHHCLSNPWIFEVLKLRTLDDVGDQSQRCVVLQSLGSVLDNNPVLKLPLKKHPSFRRYWWWSNPTTENLSFHWCFLWRGNLHLLHATLPKFNITPEKLLRAPISEAGSSSFQPQFFSNKLAVKLQECFFGICSFKWLRCSS